MEKLGFDYALLPEFGNTRDINALAATAAEATKSMKIGLFSVPYIKHPLILTTAVTTLDEISNGRAFAVLGLGGFNTLTSLGIKTWEHPLATLRESLIIMKDLLNGRSSSFDGEMFSPKGVKLSFTANKDIPIFLAAMSGEKILNLAGSAADGVLLAGPYGEYTEEIIGKVKNAARAAGRDPEKVKVAMDIVYLCYEDGEEAVETIKPFIAKEILLDPRLRPAADAEGVNVEELQQAIKRGKTGADLITDEIVDAFAVAGNPEDCIRGFKRLEKQGVDIGFPYDPWALVPLEPLPTKLNFLGKHIIPAFK